MYSLKKVTLPSSITSIGVYAFYYNQNLSSVESHITGPFDIPESAFASSSTYDNVNNNYIYSPSSATLYVPVGTKSKYETAKGWNMFAGISVLGDVNGDGDVNASDIQTIADYIMGRNPESFVFNNVDMNGDTKVDAADLVLLVNMVKSE